MLSVIYIWCIGVRGMSASSALHYLDMADGNYNATLTVCIHIVDQ